MKMHLKTIIFVSILFFVLLIFSSSVFASSIFQSIDVNELDLNSISKNKIDELKDKIEDLGNNITSTNSVDLNSVLEVYDELSTIVSNEEISDLIQDNKEVLSKSGISEDLLSASSAMLKTFDPETVKDVIQNDLNLDEILDSNTTSSTGSVITSVIENTTLSTKLYIIFKLLMSNNYFRLIFSLFTVVFIYSLIITALIFKKAGRPAFRNSYSNL